MGIAEKTLLTQETQKNLFGLTLRVSKAHYTIFFLYFRMTKTTAAKLRAAESAKNAKNNAKNKRKRANKAAAKAKQQVNQEFLMAVTEAATDYAIATAPKPAHLRSKASLEVTYPVHKIQQIVFPLVDEVLAPQSIRIRVEPTPPRPDTPPGHSIDDPDSPQPSNRPSYMVDYKASYLE